MKKIKKTFAILLAMVLLTGCGCISVFAADEFGEDYSADYKITVYSGKEGVFKDGPVVEINAKYGENVTIDLDKLGLKINDGSKYYARGLKIAGHDNDETSRIGFRTISTTVTGDQSYSVAYGLKGGMVKYTVNYVDESGTALHPSAEYYGMAGDYPVVSFQYIEGYAPDAYNLGKTLTGNEADNVFTFTYGPSTLSAEEQMAAAAAPVTVIRRTAGGGTTGDGGAGAGAGADGADGTTIGDNATPAAGGPNVVDLDDGKTPQSAPQSDLPESELSHQKKMGFIIGGACAVAAIAAAAIAIARRRQYEYEDDDE